MGTWIGSGRETEAGVFFSDDQGGIRVIPVPCLKDNYAYIVHREGAVDCFVVDPSEATPVRRVLDRQGLRLQAILNTHHHWDHVGGNEDLADGDLLVFAHESDRGRVPRQNRFVDSGDTVAVAGMELHVLHVPGHTSGAVSYVGPGLAFTGDTLFCGGCGRLFEGTAEQMYRSLNDTLATLEERVVVFTGHEYTERNLRFAQRVDPGNPVLDDRAAAVARRREQGLSCAFATMADERATNPFLRCHLASLQRMAETSDPASTFARIRAMKDRA